MKKKILGLLAFLMATTMCFASVGANWKELNTIKGYSDDTEAQSMSFVKFGSYIDLDLVNGDGDKYEKRPLSWIILDINEAENYALLLTRSVCDFNTLFSDSYKGPTWKDSYLRNWLNNSFYNDAFNEWEKSQILDNNRVFLTNVSGLSDQYKDYDECIDKVSLLSISDCEKFCYKNDMKYGRNMRLTCKALPYAVKVAEEGGVYKNNYFDQQFGTGNCRYWLIDTKHNGGDAACVTPIGDIDYQTLPTNYMLGVSPMIKIKLDAFQNLESRK